MLETKAYEEIVDLLSRSALIAFRLPCVFRPIVDTFRLRPESVSIIPESLSIIAGIHSAHATDDAKRRAAAALETYVKR